MSEQEIVEILHNKYERHSKYKVANIFVFDQSLETDFFVLLKQSGYCYEIEIKVSRADFFKDFKKDKKHIWLKTGLFEGFENKFRPNRFYYCVPENLIKIEEIPEYAGLMYIKNGNVFTIKEAPFIHKEKLTFESKLCNKFYWYWKNSETKNKILKRKILELEKKIEKS